MNLTSPDEFLLLSLSDSPSLRIPLFHLFLYIYLVTLLGNLVMLTVIVVDPRLHSPMYLLLWCFSFMDFSFSSTTVPGMLVTLLSKGSRVSFTMCITQVFFFHAFGNSENLLLSAMAYDRYVAICHPLRYSTLMSHQTCLALCSGCCVSASLHAMLHAFVTSLLKFQSPALLPHFFCDIPPLLDISTSNTTFNHNLIFIEGSAIALVPLLLVVLSYIKITLSILRIASSSGRSKAFSTCASHLTVFALFSASAVFMYFRPSNANSQRKSRPVTLMYTAITPMCNPYIYCLRNSEVKAALRKRMFCEDENKQRTRW